MTDFKLIGADLAQRLISGGSFSKEELALMCELASLLDVITMNSGRVTCFSRDQFSFHRVLSLLFGVPEDVYSLTQQVEQHMDTNRMDYTIWDARSRETKPVILFPLLCHITDTDSDTA